MSRTERRSVTEWYLAGALIAFAVPLIGASLLGLHHDLYLLVYFTVIGTFLASFVAHTDLDWRGWLRTRMWWSLAVGAAVAVAMVRNVMNQASMAHPSGIFYWFEILWRGLLYGTVDALVLFVSRRRSPTFLLRDADRRRRLRFAGLTLLLSMGITATYHLGYPQFRGTDLAQPMIGAAIATMPTALTGNPLGAIVVHDAFHAPPTSTRTAAPRSCLPTPPATPNEAAAPPDSAGRAVGRCRRHGDLRRAAPPVPHPASGDQMATGVSSPSPRHRQRPWLGLRRTPGRLALAVFRMPLRLYRRGKGWMLGRTFLMLVHVGRKTGQPHDMVAMVLADDPTPARS